MGSTRKTDLVILLTPTDDARTDRTSNGESAGEG